jgi:hypothetical protein
MTNPVARIAEFGGSRPGKQVQVWCPGCDHMHPFTIEAPPGPEGDRLNSGVTWDWDGDLERPTFSPSLLCHTSVHICEPKHTYWVCPAEDGGTCEQRGHLVGYRLPDGSAIAPKVHHPVPEGAVKVLVHQSPHEDPVWGSCHSFLRAGRWEFLSDSAHHLAGQSVDMVPLPDWLLGTDV